MHRLSACIVWLFQLEYVGVSGQIFFCLVCGLLKKNLNNSQRIWEHSGRHFLHRHTSKQKFDGREFDSHLRIKVMPLLSIPICLYRKPCICNVCCLPIKKTMGARGTLTTLYQTPCTWLFGCLLVLYDSTMHPARQCGDFRTIFSA